MKAKDRLAPAATLAIFFLPLLPLVFGTRLLCFRDAFVTHFPIAQWASARERAGVVPFLDFAASNVEPLLANPNSVSLYPTHLLYRVFSAPIAFNLHLLLHVVWAFFGAAFLARRLGASRSSSWIAGAAYALSGPYLSYASAFTNAAAAAAWAPWAIAEAVTLAGARRRFRPAAALGIALGLQLLAGEPAISAWTVAAGVIPFLARAFSPAVETTRRVVWGLAAGAISLLVTAPLLLSTAAAIPFSFRGEHLFSRDQFNAAPNVPLRMIETVLPLVFGSPRPVASGAFWAYHLFDSLQPYIFSLNFGFAGVLLACTAFVLPTFRRSAVVLTIAISSLFFGLLSFGFRTPLFEALFRIPAARHFRYPVKFVLPAVLGISILTALAADAWSAARRRRGLVAGLCAGAAVLLAAGAAAVFASPRIIAALAPQFSDLRLPAGVVLPGTLRRIELDAVTGLFALGLTAFALRPRRKARPALLLAGVAAALIPSGWPLFVTVPAKSYQEPPALAAPASGGRLFVSMFADYAVVKSGTNRLYGDDDIGDLTLNARHELWPLTGIPDGVRYAYDEDPDGSYGFVDRVMREALGSLKDQGPGRLLRAASVRYVLSDRQELFPGFVPKTWGTPAGHPIFLSEASRPVPLVRPARRVFLRNSLSGAVDLIASDRFEPRTDVVLRGPDRDPSGPPSDAAVAGFREIGNGWSADFESSAGTIAVFAATYFRYWRATIDGAAAPVEIANGSFCGVRVPPGRHRVALFYDERPFRVGAIASLIAAALILGASLKPLRPRRMD